MSDRKKLLEDDIKQCLEKMKSEELDISEKEKLAKQFEILEKARLAEVKNDAELQQERELKEREIDLKEREVKVKEQELIFKEKQDKVSWKDKLWSAGIKILEISLPIIAYAGITNKVLRFERDGTVTSLIGRGFFNKLSPKK